MREICTSGSEGGGGVSASPYPYPAKTRSRLDAFHTGCHFGRGGSRKGSKGNAVHVLAHNPAAAPATVSGELAT